LFGILANVDCIVYAVRRPMLKYVYTQSFPAAATTVVTVEPCRHAEDGDRQLGNVQALAERCAR
jgi:hypothetical protein